MAPTPITKITFLQWLKHPTTAMMIAAVSAVWILIFMVTDMAKDSNKDCMEQVAYLRDRVDKLEKQQDDYIRAMMYKDGQIRMRELVIDSLSNSQ